MIFSEFGFYLLEDIEKWKVILSKKSVHKKIIDLLLYQLLLILNDLNKITNEVIFCFIVKYILHKIEYHIKNIKLKENYLFQNVKQPQVFNNGF